MFALTVDARGLVREVSYGGLCTVYALDQNLNRPLAERKMHCNSALGNQGAIALKEKANMDLLKKGALAFQKSTGSDFIN